MHKVSGANIFICRGENDKSAFDRNKPINRKSGSDCRHLSIVAFITGFVVFLKSFTVVGFSGLIEGLMMLAEIIVAKNAALVKNNQVANKEPEHGKSHNQLYELKFGNQIHIELLIRYKNR